MSYYCIIIFSPIFRKIILSQLAYGSFWVIGSYHCLLFDPFGPDPEFVLVFALHFTIWAMLLKHPPLLFWVYCWGAYPKFVFKISLFLSFGSKVGNIIPCSPFPICLEKKKKNVKISYFLLINSCLFSFFLSVENQSQSYFT